MQLFLANQHRFFGLIRTLVPRSQDAEDVLQETSKAMWQKFDQFERGTNFAAWGLAFARIQALKHQSEQKRHPMRFSNDLLDQLADEAERVSDEVDNRRQALRLCLQKLPDRHMEILRLRYESEATVASIGQMLGLTGSAIYKSLSAVHSGLLKCIRRRIKDEVSRG